MMMRQRKTLRERIEARIARKKRDDVFLPHEFADLGSEDQVLRVLRGLVREGRLVHLGYGVYGRAVVSQLSGKPILYSPNGFIGAPGAHQTRGAVGTDRSRAGVQRRALPTGAGQSGRAGDGAFLAAAPVRECG